MGITMHNYAEQNKQSSARVDNSSTNALQRLVSRDRPHAVWKVCCSCSL